MNIIARGTLNHYIGKYPAAKTALLTWYYEMTKAEYRTFNELKSVYGSASIVGDNRVIFNIRGNEYRLIVSVNFRKLAAYVIWFGTHKEYDRIDARTVAFKTSIGK